ncbi:exosome complex protein Rrp42 [Candidatus Woesearchaeota archaeon]|nr:exosome complex protein Rrp42 [Candidatus Woesearchaeota archaeon]
MISREYIESLITQHTRVDGRKFDEYRKIEIEYGISAKSAEGSARVKIGNTEVVAGVKMELGTPFPDKPDEGSIMVNVELLPLSSPFFESGPPSIDAIELSRVTDRGIRESKALDFKKLCVRKGEKVWLLFIDIYPINTDGNLFDACNLVALAAIRDAVFPKIVDDKIDYHEKTKTKVPLTKLPLACTVWKVGDTFLVDPSEAEERAANARLSVVFTEDGKICAMQKGGDFPLTEEEIMEAVHLAEKKTKELRRHFT